MITMTPMQRAEEAIGLLRLWDGGPVGDVLTEDECRQIALAAITAFLDAAAMDGDLCRSIFDAANADAHLSTRLAGNAAILALKEALR